MLKITTVTKKVLLVLVDRPDRPRVTLLRAASVRNLAKVRVFVSQPN